MKYTATNNQTLAHIKPVFNSRIYAVALWLVNTRDERTAKAYVNYYQKAEHPFFPNAGRMSTVEVNTWLAAHRVWKLAQQRNQH